MTPLSRSEVSNAGPPCHLQICLLARWQCKWLCNRCSKTKLGKRFWPTTPRRQIPRNAKLLMGSLWSSQPSSFCILSSMCGSVEFIMKLKKVQTLLSFWMRKHLWQRLLWPNNRLAYRCCLTSVPSLVPTLFQLCSTIFHNIRSDFRSDIYPVFSGCS